MSTSFAATSPFVRIASGLAHSGPFEGRGSSLEETLEACLNASKATATAAAVMLRLLQLGFPNHISGRNYERMFLTKTEGMEPLNWVNILEKITADPNFQLNWDQPIPLADGRLILTKNQLDILHEFNIDSGKFCQLLVAHTKGLLAAGKNGVDSVELFTARIDWTKVDAKVLQGELRPWFILALGENGFFTQMDRGSKELSSMRTAEASLDVSLETSLPLGELNGRVLVGERISYNGHFYFKNVVDIGSVDMNVDWSGGLAVIAGLEKARKPQRKLVATPPTTPPAETTMVQEIAVQTAFPQDESCTCGGETIPNAEAALRQAEQAAATATTCLHEAGQVAVPEPSEVTRGVARLSQARAGAERTFKAISGRLPGLQRLKENLCSQAGELDEATALLKEQIVRVQELSTEVSRSSALLEQMTGETSRELTELQKKLEALAKASKAFEELSVAIDEE